jgi:hypothetical protein
MKTKAPSPLPFVNTVGDSIELMKKMWGIAGLPSVPNAGGMASMAMRLPQQLPRMVAPTFDIDELDQRIADLHAVEQWLELNAGMLRTTIQTLEVQRATIATLKGFGGAMMAPLGGVATPAESTRVPAPAVAPAPAAAPGSAPRKTARKRTQTKRAPTPLVADAPLNPTAWWNTLQDQFTRIASTAAAAGTTHTEKSTVRSPTQRQRKSKR